jgi:hypothetical protein
MKRWRRTISKAFARGLGGAELQKSFQGLKPSKQYGRKVRAKALTPYHIQSSLIPRKLL